MVGRQQIQTPTLFLYKPINANEGTTAAHILITMNAIMRKVTFTLGQPEHWPNMTDVEKQEMEELSKVRNGYLHAYTQDVDTSKDIPFAKTLALVEDLTGGKMHLVDPLHMSFVEPFKALKQ